MTRKSLPDAVVGRIVLEFSKKYIKLYLCDHNGKVLDWDAFKYEDPLDSDVATEERDSFWHILYDYANTIVNTGADEPKELGDGDGGDQADS